MIAGHRERIARLEALAKSPVTDAFYYSMQASKLKAELRFAIFDWAGNELAMHGRFESFECAWDYILGEMADKLGLCEEDFQEYEVREL